MQARLEECGNRVALAHCQPQAYRLCKCGTVPIKTIECHMEITIDKALDATCSPVAAHWVTDYGVTGSHFNMAPTPLHPVAEAICHTCSGNHMGHAVVWQMASTLHAITKPSSMPGRGNQPNTHTLPIFSDACFCA